MKLLLLCIICSLILLLGIRHDYYTKAGAYTLTLNIGSPPQKQQMIIDQILPQSVSSRDYYKIEDSKTSQILETIDKFVLESNFIINASISSDLLTFTLSTKEIIEITNFTFAYLNFTIYDRYFMQNPISFSYSFTNKSYSIIHELYYKGIIHHLSYSFVPESQFFGLLYFGEEPMNEIKNLNYASCDINSKKAYWGCKLNYINLIDENNSTMSYRPNEYEELIFQSGQRVIKAPRSFMKWINGTLFDKFTETNECIILTYFEREAYRCSDKTIYYFPEIFEIIIEDNSFKIPISKLILKYGGFIEFQISFDIKYENKWILGTLFLNEYITTFDYENSKVFFYSNDTFQTNKNEKLIQFKNVDNNLIKRLYTFIICCCLLSISILLKHFISLKIYQMSLDI